MSRISSFISAYASLAETSVPRARLDRVGQSLHRRLADVIEEAFQHACMLGDLDTGADLIAVLEDQRDRWINEHGSERRDEYPHLARMKDELIRRRSLKLAMSTGSYLPQDAADLPAGFAR